MTDYLNNTASELIFKAVGESKDKQKEQMGRDYCSAYEVWARLKEMFEAAERAKKSLDALQKDLWSAVVDKNEDEITVELRQIENSAANVCMTYAAIAATASRAAEEL